VNFHLNTDANTPNTVRTQPKLQAVLLVAGTSFLAAALAPAMPRAHAAPSSSTSDVSVSAQRCPATLATATLAKAKPESWTFSILTISTSTRLVTPSL